jgi:6-phosphogluconolactonase
MASFLDCKAQNMPLYIGTYTDGDSKGIYQAKFNTETGELSHFKLAAETQNPSYIAYSPNKKFIYAVGEGGDGTVSAFKLKENGNLEFLNTVSSNGGAPCHISINPAGDKVVVSNYVGGNVSLYEIKDDGTLNPAYQVFKYSTKEKASHAHSAQFYKSNLFVSDLGMDALYIYTLNNDGKTYDLVSSSSVSISEKAGPRHFVITKDGNFIYNINEYASTITASKKEINGFLLIDNYSTLAKDYKGANSCADIHLSKNEDFLYGSNRGENTIAVFKRNTVDGTLTKIQNIDVEGEWPRNFTLDPTGKFLLVANQKSNTISVFKIHPDSGTLSYLNSVKTPSPVCLLF